MIESFDIFGLWTLVLGLCPLSVVRCQLFSCRKTHRILDYGQLTTDKTKVQIGKDCNLEPFGCDVLDQITHAA